FPKLYPGAVSIRLTPAFGASLIVSTTTWRSWSPPHADPPPMDHVPRPILEISIPVFPNFIVFITDLFLSPVRYLSVQILLLLSVVHKVLREHLIYIRLLFDSSGSADILDRHSRRTVCIDGTVPDALALKKSGYKS